MRSRWFAGVVSIALLVIVVSPLRRHPIDDGFPLSTYPMFASPRATTMTLDYAYGVTAGGERRTLAPSVLGTGEVLQAVMMYARAVSGGKASADALCTRIAAAVEEDARWDDVTAIVIVSGTHDAVDFLVHGVQGHETERARCVVARP